MTAIISACGQYRYKLTRPGDMTATRGPAVFVMLNPSTADASVDDPTIRRCMGFARAWGCDGIVVVNLYAFRATQPSDLWIQSDPVGRENDNWLIGVAHEAEEIVCAWGVNARPERVAEVTAILMTACGRLRCLGATKSGAPRHPLYVRADQELVDWAAP